MTTPAIPHPSSPELDDAFDALLAAFAHVEVLLEHVPGRVPSPADPVVPLVERLAAVADAVSSLQRARARAVDRVERDAAGMTGVPSWHEFRQVLDAVDPAWNVVVAVDDGRYPEVDVDAADAQQAQVRAVTWAVRDRHLPEPIPVDGPWHRLHGGGVREVSPGRFRVPIEGW